MSSATEPIRRDRPFERPPGFPRTFWVTVPNNGPASSVLDRIAAVWEVVAKWGRWCDEDLGDWPETQNAIGELPAWFAERASSDPDFGVESWMDDLHDREWWWWSGAIIGQYIKIDIAADSSPISTWPLQYVIEKSGGVVARRGDWNVDAPLT